MITLITGYKGFIGRKVFAKIPDAIGIDIKDGYNILSCDLLKADVIYHLAAQTSVESSWHDPLHDVDNIKMIARLVKEYPDAKIIYASSAAAQFPIESPYGFSKWACEEYLRIFHRNYVICVFPNVYGEGSKSFVDICKENETVTIFGDGSHKRDYVHVDDIVDGLLKAKEWDVGKYYMGSGIGISTLEVAKNNGKVFAPDRKEQKESVLPNTTPNWQPKHLNIYD